METGPANQVLFAGEESLPVMKAPRITERMHVVFMQARQCELTAAGA